MSTALQTGALVCVLLGLLGAAAVLGRMRDGRLALSVLLDFLLAAGLLRLGGDPSFRELLVAAVILALRRVLSQELLPAVRARSRSC